jgi:DNA invertase Pin-like site-specific DNA recombinase
MNKGEKNGRSKLTEQEVVAIKELLKLGFTQRQIAKMFGVWSSTISYINQGKIWAHLEETDDEQTET